MKKLYLVCLVFFMCQPSFGGDLFFNNGNSDGPSNLNFPRLMALSGGLGAVSAGCSTPIDTWAAAPSLLTTGSRAASTTVMIASPEDADGMVSSLGAFNLWDYNPLSCEKEHFGILFDGNGPLSANGLAFDHSSGTTYAWNRDLGLHLVDFNFLNDLFQGFATQIVAPPVGSDIGSMTALSDGRILVADNSDSMSFDGSPTNGTIWEVDVATGAFNHFADFPENPVGSGDVRIESLAGKEDQLFMLGAGIDEYKFGYDLVTGSYTNFGNPPYSVDGLEAGAAYVLIVPEPTSPALLLMILPVLRVTHSKRIRDR